MRKSVVGANGGRVDSGLRVAFPQALKCSGSAADLHTQEPLGFRYSSDKHRRAPALCIMVERLLYHMTNRSLIKKTWIPFQIIWSNECFWLAWIKASAIQHRKDPDKTVLWPSEYLNSANSEYIEIARLVLLAWIPFSKCVCNAMSNGIDSMEVGSFEWVHFDLHPVWIKAFVCQKDALKLAFRWLQFSSVAAKSYPCQAVTTVNMSHFQSLPK